jgi:hypothetical protein
MSVTHRKEWPIRDNIMVSYPQEIEELDGIFLALAGSRN